MSPADSGPARTTTIHDIGYRHYSGPRLGRGFAIRTLFVHSLRGVFGLGRPAKSKILPFTLFAIMCVPALISVALQALLPDAAGFSGISYSSYIFNAQAVSAIFLAAQAPQMISHDLRFRIMPLYFSRPLGAADYVLAKLSALVAALLILFVIPLTILFVGALINKLNAWDQAEQYLPALAGAVLFALVLASLGATIAALTPRRGFGVAAIIATYLVSYGAVTALQSVLEATTRDTAAGYVGLFSPYTLVEGVQTWGLRQDYTGIGAIDPGPGGAVFILGVLVVLAATIGILLARYRKVATS